MLANYFTSDTVSELNCLTYYPQFIHDSSEGCIKQLYWFYVSKAGHERKST